MTGRLTLKDCAIAGGIPAIVAGVAILCFLHWQRTPPPLAITPRMPGTDHYPRETEPTDDIHGQLTHGPGQPADLPGHWPGFRGPNRDAIAPALAKTGTNLTVRWVVELGEGHAGAAVHNGRVYILDYDRDRQCDALRCLSLADGREIWRYSYPVAIKRNHGMSRTVPAVNDRYVVALGPKCHVTCLDAVSGNLRWSLHLTRDFGTKIPPWYAGQCPLLDDDRAILAPAGHDLLIAVDCATGQILWRTPNPRGWTMSHASIIPAEIAGVKQYLYVANGGVAGIRASDGALLWDTDAWQIPIATIPSPVPLDNDQILLTGGYNAGAMLLQISRADPDHWHASVRWRLPATVFGADQHTPIFHNGHIYAVRPRGQLVCLNPDGTLRWDSGTDRFGLGPFLIAGDKLFALSDTGRLTILEARPDAYRPLAQHQILHGPDAWAPLALAGNRLLARDLTQMVCLELHD